MVPNINTELGRRSMGGFSPHRDELFYSSCIQTTINHDERVVYISNTHSCPLTVNSFRKASSMVGSYLSVQVCDTNCPVKEDLPTPWNQLQHHLKTIPPLPNSAILYSLIPFGEPIRVEPGCLVMAKINTTLEQQTIQGLFSNPNMTPRPR
jgi:hypothetical protein